MKKTNNLVRVLALISTVAISALTSGCGVQSATIDRYTRPLSEKHLVTKNYKIGESSTVSIGDPIIKLRDYWVEMLEAQTATPDRSTTVTFGGTEIRLQEGIKYRVVGRVTADNWQYNVIEPAEKPVFYVLADADGNLINRIAISPNKNDHFLVSTPKATITDQTAKVLRDSTENVKTTKGYENFEILYTGTNANGLNMTYREFSPDGLARVAFFQNLTYEPGAKSISFKKFRLAVHNASSESIRFTVLSDGLEPGPSK